MDLNHVSVVLLVYSLPCYFIILLLLIILCCYKHGTTLLHLCIKLNDYGKSKFLAFIHALPRLWNWIVRNIQCLFAGRDIEMTAYRRISDEGDGQEVNDETLPFVPTTPSSSPYSAIRSEAGSSESYHVNVEVTRL